MSDSDYLIRKVVPHIQKINSPYVFKCTKCNSLFTFDLSIMKCHPGKFYIARNKTLLVEDTEIDFKHKHVFSGTDKGFVKFVTDKNIKWKSDGYDYEYIMHGKYFDHRTSNFIQPYSFSCNGKSIYKTVSSYLVDGQESSKMTIYGIDELLICCSSDFVFNLNYSEKQLKYFYEIKNLLEIFTSSRNIMEMGKILEPFRRHKDIEYHERMSYEEIRDLKLENAYIVGIIDSIERKCDVDEYLIDIYPFTLDAYPNEIYGVTAVTNKGKIQCSFYTMSYYRMRYNSMTEQLHEYICQQPFFVDFMRSLNITNYNFKDSVEKIKILANNLENFIPVDPMKHIDEVPNAQLEKMSRQFLYEGFKYETDEYVIFKKYKNVEDIGEELLIMTNYNRVNSFYEIDGEFYDNEDLPYNGKYNAFIANDVNTKTKKTKLSDEIINVLHTLFEINEFISQYLFDKIQEKYLI